ncbi:hypothetical protein BDV37DRAFT_284804 [Aspergillus pseudonomiae]|uniref:DOMON domain-containing protein n=1 Tax=Aspergillus pseudonomiae TaxID=1506151 RepID=A0A5N7D7B3_9EURO|nr:uncharacterized protein BDV37DRAFT_284804 [Aspergillus pseudonomiae]KAE8402322.1 hypothetical protein BDV37DRAFT_284804 [Aspergillus pseudonomiae]
MGWSLIPRLFLIGCSLANLVYGQTCQQSFRLYAYGEGIGGLPVFYADGSAEIGNRSLSTANETVSIYFTIPEETPTVWRAQANRTESRSPSFDSMVFTLPSISGTSGGNVGFKDPDDSARLDTKTLKLYGNYVLIDSQNANFFTTRSESGVYSLQWSANETATPNRIPLKLRAIQPSTDSVLAGGFNPRGEL